MIPLDPTAPLRSLRALAGVSHQAMGEARDPPVTKVAVINAEHDGAGIRLSTLQAYATAVGMRLVIGVEHIGGA